MPEVSVVMAAYNSRDTIAEAVGSVLAQSLRDFELIVVDDGSSDGTAGVAASFGDGRVRCVRNRRNLGLPASLNRGLSCARGRYVARMDADDVMLPDRLRVQAEFLSAHSGISIVGSDYVIFKGGAAVGRRRMPVTDDEIRGAALNHSPFCHPTVMARREVFERFRYDTRFRCCQDYELWSRVLTEFKAANIPQALLKYRLSENGNTARSLRDMSERRAWQGAIYRSFIISQLGLAEEDYDEEMQFVLGSSSEMSAADITRFPPARAGAYLDRLAERNRRSGYCSGRGMRMIAGKVWLKYMALNRARLKPKELAEMALCRKFVWGLAFLLRRRRMHK